MRIPFARRLAFGCMVLAGMTAAEHAAGQNNDSFRDAAGASVNYRETPYAARGECAEIVSRGDEGLTVLSAGVHRDGETPPHCRVTGLIPSEVLFELNMPLDWNGRFYMHGNGGFAGAPPSARAAVRNRALNHGFATAYTNTGHDSRTHPGATFAYNDLQKTIDYLFRAVHLTAVRSKALIADYYGREPRRSYWDGCSMGGRQGMVFSQRFPEDFDGIVAGAPAFDFTGTMAAYVWQGRIMRELDLDDAKLDLLAERVYARCDRLDGAEDGLIDDPRRCDFDPSRDLPRCSRGSGGSCFTAAEVEALQRLYKGMPDRQPAIPGIIPGSEIAAPTADGRHRVRGWEPWLINGDRESFQVEMVQSFLKYLAFEVDDPDYDWSSFPLEEAPEGLDRLVLDLLDARDADLRRFRDGGGKLIAYFGWADAAISPLPMLDYYERLAGAMGAPPDDFFRLYMIPGMFHCTGGAGAHEVDFMSPLIDWVEAGEPPYALIGTRHDGPELRLERQHCPWPSRFLRQNGSAASADSAGSCDSPP